MRLYITAILVLLTSCKHTVKSEVEEPSVFFNKQNLSLYVDEKSGAIKSIEIAKLHEGKHYFKFPPDSIRHYFFDSTVAPLFKGDSFFKKGYNMLITLHDKKALQRYYGFVYLGDENSSDSIVKLTRLLK